MMSSFLSKPKRVEVTHVESGDSVVLPSMSEAGRQYVGRNTTKQATVRYLCRTGSVYNGHIFTIVDDYSDDVSKNNVWTRKPIFQIDIDTEGIIGYFSSVSNAGTFGYENFNHNCPDADLVRRRISSCINGHLESAFGYKWRPVRHDEIVDNEGPVTIVVTPP